MIRYCSLACQKAEWPAHKLECKALKAFQHRAETGKQGTVREPGTTVRLMGRLVWERKRLGDGWWGCIERLQTNRETLGSDEHLTQLPLRLVDYLGVRDAQAGEGQMKELGFSSAAELLDLVGRTTVNTFVAYSSDLTAVGAALSSVVAMINHSCVPNVAVVYPNGPGGKQPMHVVSIKDLEPGDELTTFYLDVSDPYPLRQKTLEQRYSFRCTCPLCTRVAKPRQGKKPRVDPREALWCGRPGCAGWVAASGEGRICTSCKQASTVDVAVTEEVLREGREVLERLDKMMGQGMSAAGDGDCAGGASKLTPVARAGDHDGALEAAQATVARLTAVQPPSAYPLLSLLRQLQTALILSATSKTDWREAAGLFEEAIRFHFLSIAGMQASQGAVFCEGHPARAIALATLSTLLVRQVTSEEAEWIKTNTGSSAFLTRLPPVPLVGAQRDQAGITLMVQAIAELKIAYGNSEEGGQPGRRLIEQVREWKESEAIARLAV